jgi:hypothetical protein
VVACSVAQAKALLALPREFEVVVLLDRDTAAWLRTLESPPARLVLRQPTHERLTESAERDVDLREFFQAFPHPVPIEGVPACVSGRAPRARPRTLDAAMLTPEARLEIFRYTRRYLLTGYLTKSLRCKGCAENARCEGLHINHVRAHGYGVMQPLDAPVGS